MNPPENILINRKLVLGSASPRRKELLAGLGFNFIVSARETEESFPSNLNTAEVAEYLARKKSEAFDNEVNDGALVITADTVVRLDDEIINKPTDEACAIEMLSRISDREHIVTTGVCLRWDNEVTSFSDHTKVVFSSITEDEIKYYLKKCSPYDKAGSYGIQDWIGLAFIDRIEGSYHNVMGLPTSRLYSILKTIKF
jgi:septum formation protein